MSLKRLLVITALLASIVATGALMQDDVSAAEGVEAMPPSPAIFTGSPNPSTAIVPAPLTIALNGAMPDRSRQRASPRPAQREPIGDASQAANTPADPRNGNESNPLSEGQLWTVAALMMLIVAVRRRHANRAL